MQGRAGECLGEHVLLFMKREALQKKGVPKRACSAVHEGSLVECDVCEKYFRRRDYLGKHLVLFKKGFLLYCDVCGKGCSNGNYLEGHIRTVHDGMVQTVLFVQLFIYYIGGVKTSWKQLQSESDFCDVTLVLFLIVHL